MVHHAFVARKPDASVSNVLSRSCIIKEVVSVDFSFTSRKFWNHSLAVKQLNL